MNNRGRAILCTCEYMFILIEPILLFIASLPRIISREYPSIHKKVQTILVIINNKYTAHAIGIAL